MLNICPKVPQEHVETMEVLREAMYLMTGMEGCPDYLDFWDLRSALFKPIMDKTRCSSMTEMHGILEKWLLRAATTEDTMDALKKLETGHEG